MEPTRFTSISFDSPIRPVRHVSGINPSLVLTSLQFELSRICEWRYTTNIGSLHLRKGDSQYSNFPSIIFSCFTRTIIACTEYRGTCFQSSVVFPTPIQHQRRLPTKKKVEGDAFSIDWYWLPHLQRALNDIVYYLVWKSHSFRTRCFTGVADTPNVLW